MPNCFTLTRRSNLEAGPVPLNTIDAEMCQFFNEPVDPKRWYQNWYNTIGFDLAMGNSFEQIRADYLADRVADDQSAFDAWTKLIEIVDWLEANFTADAWYETKRSQTYPVPVQ